MLFVHNGRSPGVVGLCSVLADDGVFGVSGVFLGVCPNRRVRTREVFVSFFRYPIRVLRVKYAWEWAIRRKGTSDIPALPSERRFGGDNILTRAGQSHGSELAQEDVL